MKKIIKLSVLVLVGLFGLTSLSPTIVFAAGSTGYADVCSQDVPQGVKDAAGCPGNSNSDLPTVIQNILNAIIGVAGVVSVVFIVIGGIQYITSTGDPGKTKKPKVKLRHCRFVFLPERRERNGGTGQTECPRRIGDHDTQ